MTQYKPISTMPHGIRVAFSGVEDATMAAGGGIPSGSVHQKNTETFLHQYGFDSANHARVFVTYLPESTYTHIERVEAGDNGPIKSDALFTTVPGKTITLPVADCIATVVYDPVTHMLGVLHLGRHASVAGLIEEFAIRVADELGSDPRDWHVWMSPSLKSDHDRMEYFTPPHPEEWKVWRRSGDDGMIHIDIPGHNRDRFERLGVSADRIFVSPENTYTDERYFSHRAAVELGKPTREGRMMVVARLDD